MEQNMSEHIQREVDDMVLILGNSVQNAIAAELTEFCVRELKWSSDVFNIECGKANIE